MTAYPRGNQPLVAVLLGTDCHPFDRLVSWATELASVGTYRCFVQHGATRLPGLLPSGVESAEMLDATELDRLLAEADCVVTHGGPGLVMEARDAGHHPIVVPRDPALGEHVDQHQLRFTGVIARAGMISRADTQSAFEAAVQSTVRHGRRTESLDCPSAVAERFGAMVEQLPRGSRAKAAAR